MRKQYDWSAPRPTRPRSWCSSAKPKWSACSITMHVAFGTSTPTSTTVVATSTCILFARKSSRILFCSSSSILLWMSAHLYLVNTCCERYVNISSADLSVSLEDASPVEEALRDVVSVEESFMLAGEVFVFAVEALRSVELVLFSS